MFVPKNTMLFFTIAPDKPAAGACLESQNRVPLGQISSIVCLGCSSKTHHWCCVFILVISPVSNRRSFKLIQVGRPSHAAVVSIRLNFPSSILTTPEFPISLGKCRVLLIFRMSLLISSRCLLRFSALSVSTSFFFVTFISVFLLSMSVFKLSQ